MSSRTQISEYEKGNGSTSFALTWLMIRLRELSADMVLFPFLLQLYQYMWNGYARQRKGNRSSDESKV